MKVTCKHCNGIGHKTGGCGIIERIYDLAGRDSVVKAWVSQGLNGALTYGGMFYG